MAKYRTKTVVIEAAQYHKDQVPAPDGVMFNTAGEPFVQSGKQEIKVNHCDWIVALGGGKFEVLGPAEFVKKYDRI